MKHEVHEHCYIAGPRANTAGYKFSHSHADDNGSHAHDDGVNRTGPSCRTIDKDEWYARTGLRGGGRKKYTAKATGPQLPCVPTAAPSFDVVIVGDGGASVAGGGEGGALHTADRMRLAMGACVASVTIDRGVRGAA